MTVKRKALKINNKSNIEEIIKRGGKSFQEIPQKLELRFTLRIPKNLMDMIDVKRQQRLGNISRNQWIIEAIDKIIK